MFVSQLKCSMCSYSSPVFGESLDIHEGTKSFVFQCTDTMAIIVKEIPITRLAEHSIVLDSPGISKVMEEHFANDSERFIKIPLVDSQVPVDAVCPQCGNSPIMKVVVGLQ